MTGPIEGAEGLEVLECAEGGPPERHCGRGRADPILGAMYEASTVYIVGNSKTNSENAIMAVYKGFYIGFVVEPASGLIVDVSCISSLRTTDEFVRSLFIGKTMRLDDESLEAEIRRRYHGSSQKAIIVAYKDAAKTLAEIQRRAGS